MVEALADLLTTPPSPVEVMIESLAVQARETSGQALHAATDNSHKLSDFQQTLAVIIENNPEMIAFAEANQAKHQAIIDKYHQQQAEKEALRIPTREDIEKINKDLGLEYLPADKKSAIFMQAAIDAKEKISFDAQVDKLHEVLNAPEVTNDMQQAILKGIANGKMGESLPDNLLTDKEDLKDFISKRHGGNSTSVQDFLDSFQTHLQDGNPLKTYESQAKLVIPFAAEKNSKKVTKDFRYEASREVYYRNLIEAREKCIDEISKDPEKIDAAIANSETNRALIFDALTAFEKDAVVHAARLKNYEAQEKDGMLAGHSDNSFASIILYKKLEQEIASNPDLLRQAIDNLEVNRTSVLERTEARSGGRSCG